MGTTVLVFPASLLRGVGDFEGCTLDVGKYVAAIFDTRSAFFMDREQAEHDPRFKQIIPYVVLRHGELVFSYVRGRYSGEARLIGRRSIGVGGHIEQEDLACASFGREVYLAAAKREVGEEVHVDSAYAERVVGLINENFTDVGRVHFGILHIWDLERPEVTPREKGITGGGFLRQTELKERMESLEMWSRIAMEILEHPTICKPHGGGTEDL